MSPKATNVTVCFQYVRCGREWCHCMKGGSLHGPYLYRFWREEGRLRKRYLRRATVTELHEQAARRQHRQERQAARIQWRALVAALRGLEPNE
jgi:hypothetical protein